MTNSKTDYERWSDGEATKDREGFSFKEKLAEGLQRERDFLELWGSTLGLVASTADELGFDMVHSSGRRAELKTESRKFEATPNVFIERWSSIERQTAGGAWQSTAKGVSLLYHWFPTALGYPNGVVVLFDSLPLLMRNIEKRNLVMKEIPNRAEHGRAAFTGGGYAVKRQSLLHISHEFLLPISLLKEETK